ncbi:hypothetical protein DL768_003971 [Monosporascus sp. mg162]|nr:hypothetical protein DL768_003971 [Monosporascus sp. mg162]
MKNHISETDGGTFITYLMKTMRNHNPPLIQVFIRPSSKPLLILGDFPEAHDLLVRRKDFDSSHTLGDLVLGLAPDHHIHLETGDAWKAQRRLVQDLMTPSFLHNVAGPAIHRNVATMISLWRTKGQLASGRPWAAAGDINQIALDAVTVFAFGESFEHNATLPALDALQAMSAEAIESISSKGRDEPVEFPKGQDDYVLRATRALTKTVGEVQGNPWPSLTWAYVTRKPKVRKAMKIKEGYIMKELRDSVERLEGTSGRAIKSAVDQMIVWEKDLAEKQGRTPEYFSRAMVDETAETISSQGLWFRICWALKFLANQPGAQSKLRAALDNAFLSARAERRNPTINEITDTNIPCLDATMEEMLRCAGTAPVVDRVATADAEPLGYRIPKGTVVTCLVTRPSMMSPDFDIDLLSRSPSSQTVMKNGRHRAWDPAEMSVFNPDGWIVSGDGSDSEKNSHFDASAGPQLAFGLGTRGCYGKRLVYLEMRIVLTLVAWNFELLQCLSSLSRYNAELIITNEPIQCDVRLHQIEPDSE